MPRPVYSFGVRIGMGRGALAGFMCSAGTAPPRHCATVPSEGLGGGGKLAHRRSKIQGERKTPIAQRQTLTFIVPMAHRWCLGRNFGVIVIDGPGNGPEGDASLGSVTLRSVGDDNETKFERTFAFEDLVGSGGGSGLEPGCVYVFLASAHLRTLDLGPLYLTPCTLYLVIRPSSARPRGRLCPAVCPAVYPTTSPDVVFVCGRLCPSVPLSIRPPVVVYVCQFASPTLPLPPRPLPTLPPPPAPCLRQRRRDDALRARSLARFLTLCVGIPQARQHGGRWPRKPGYLRASVRCPPDPRTQGFFQFLTRKGPVCF